MGAMKDLGIYVEEAVKSAAVTLLWSATDAAEDGGHGFPIGEQGNEYSDMVLEQVPELASMVCRFVVDNWQTLEKVNVSDKITPGHCGHNFVLSAIRSGAGFKDRGLGADGDKLDEGTRFYEYDLEAEFMLDDAGEVTWLMVMNHILVGDSD
jgi:hypothetical protein